jgi:hypothetical protein
MRDPQHCRKSRGQAMVEFALLASLLFLLVMGIFDFGRAISVYINIAEAAHEGARQLVLRSNYLLNPTPCTSPSLSGMAPNTGYIWISPNRTPGNPQVTVRVTYLFAPMTAMISDLTGTSFIMTAGSSMRAEY